MEAVIAMRMFLVAAVSDISKNLRTLSMAAATDSSGGSSRELVSPGEKCDSSTAENDIKLVDGASG